MADTTAARTGHRRLLAREFLASALYMALVLLAGIVAVPPSQLPSDRVVVALILGTAVGLVLAHWFAFRLAAHVTAEAGGWSPSAAQEAGAQLAGGLAVAVLASLPYLLLDGTAARRADLLLLAALPAAAGCIIARLRGCSWVYTAWFGIGCLVAAAGVVVVKIALGH